MRDRTKTDDIRYFPFSNNTFNLSTYSFRLGSKVVPTKSPENYVEMYAEVIKAISSLSDINHAPSIELNHIVVDYIEVLMQQMMQLNYQFKLQQERMILEV
jgi:hypothetical protein